MEKTCSKCNTVFDCQNETRGCWCEQLELSAETLQHLEDNFQNCLCPGCLSSYARSQATGEITSSPA